MLLVSFQIYRLNNYKYEANSRKPKTSNKCTNTNMSYYILRIDKVKGSTFIV